MAHTLLELNSVTHEVLNPEGKKQKILDKINLVLKEQEIVAIVGKSGAGKSTLLRIIAELISPTKGKVKVSFDKEDDIFDVSMIFQNVALFPWLTVCENVDLGLESTKLTKDQRKEIVLKTIDMIGLDGFSKAYPKELSGGMRQRVGFARALAVDPTILLMDEPFSALDILTANTLKSDFLDLWVQQKTSLKSVVIVTHSIEEAVTMADRILVFGSNPGRLVSEIELSLPRPRDNKSVEFRKMVDEVYAELSIASTKQVKLKKNDDLADLSKAQKLPNISPHQLAAIAAEIASRKNSANLSAITEVMRINIEDVVHIVEGLTLLKFAAVSDSKITLTKEGKAFAKGDLDERKKIFAVHLLENVPLAFYIKKILHDRVDHRAPLMRFQNHLEDYMSREDAALSLKTVIRWGRYGEIFIYDDSIQMFQDFT